MANLSELIVLLPTYNEELGIGEVLSRIPFKKIEQLGYHTRAVVIDGNSKDLTCKIASSMGAEIIHQTGASGKGNGVRQAINLLSQNFSDSNKDLLIMMDSDASYSPESLPRFIIHLQNNDVVWGSRFKGKIDRKAMSNTNKLGNRILSVVASLLFLSKTTDLCTGYWGFRIPALSKVSLSATGFNLEADIFCSVVKSKFKTKEIPIIYVHREGESNLKWYIDGPRIMIMTLRRRFGY